MSLSRLICIVDDIADYRALLHIFFKRYCAQHSTQLFPSGQAFLAALDQSERLPSLILLDRHMPGLDGHQVLSWLKQHPSYKRIPVVMMSAGATEEEIDNCYEAGANSFLRKDFSKESVEASLSTVFHYWLALIQLPSNS